ncbi:MAG: hypothetical protein AAFR52_05310 [Pseudomonadota bacterium]
MGSLAYHDGAGPYFVALLAHWPSARTTVELTVEPRDTLPVSWTAPPRCPGPDASLETVSARRAWALVRIERYAALDRARRAAKVLARWPLAWARDAAGTGRDPAGLAPRIGADRSDAPGGIPERFLAVIDGAPGPMTVLPRRHGWRDGTRRA